MALPIDEAAQHKSLRITAGAKLYVTSGPNVGEEDQMVHVRWEGHQLAMFAIDLMAGGIDVHEHARGAAS